jgi:type II secretory pathway pseudopilin PulG
VELHLRRVMKKDRGLARGRALVWRWGGEWGFTLVEAVIAMAILGMVGGVFLHGAAIGPKTVMVSQERVAAESLAKSQMEDTKAQEYVPEATSYPQITIPSDLAGQGYDVEVSGDPLHDPDDGIQEITVSVTRGGETLWTIVDYKMDR